VEGVTGVAGIQESQNGTAKVFVPGLGIAFCNS
jgi:hypothetical protein